MLQCRRLFSVLLLFGILVALFAVPASAKKLDSVTLTISFPSSTLFVAKDNSGSGWYYPLIQTPYAFSRAPDVNGFSHSFNYSWENRIPSYISTVEVNPSFTVPQYVTFDFVVGDGDGECDVSFARFISWFNLIGVDSSGSTTQSDLFNFNNAWSIAVDSGETSSFSPGTSWEGTVKKRFTIHLALTPGYTIAPSLYPVNGHYNMSLYVQLPSFQVNSKLTTIDRIELKVGEISTTVKNIENGVIDINNNLVDMKQQLSDSQSSIWSAGSSAIAEKVGELFSPSSNNLTTATEQLKNTVKDKLGGAYDAVDAVTAAGGQLKDKLNNPSAAESITFPGISLPAAGSVEAITILPSMEVSLPPKLTSVLQPVLGSIVCILVGLYTFSSLKDMVVCFMSSMSYAQYVHRNKGGDSD